MHDRRKKKKEACYVKLLRLLQYIKLSIPAVKVRSKKTQ